jgi:hypothetical protein
MTDGNVNPARPEIRESKNVAAVPYVNHQGGQHV